MDISDFKGLTKYKIILPTFYISSWISMFIGPVYFDVLYQRISIFFLIYFNLKIAIYLTIMFIVTYKSYFILKRVQS